ncbi:MAG: domain S-box protein [Chitinophagaceae bacterium]|nr:domain S-box protein [Chitinophagaceae bacterium]
MNYTALKILVIEDDEDDFFIIKEDIQKIPYQQFIIDWCPKYKDALEKMASREYAIYFVDYFLGAKTGLQLLKEAMNRNCQEPIILLTGKGNHTIDIEAMQAGAYDYLIKSELNTEKLERCIRYSVEKANAAKALRENERKFRTIFEKSKDMVFIADQDLNFKDVNAAGSSLLEYSKDELLQQKFFSLFADIPTANKIENELLAEGMADDIEVSLLTKSNIAKNCILSVAREKDLNGTIYYQGIIHDITTLRRNEKANLQLQKLAITGRLVHTLAHEIRNPLNNISLSVSELMEEKKGDEPDMYLDIIQRNSVRIGGIITELLNSSKPAEIELKKKSLQDIMEESLASALDRITLKRIELNVSYTSESLHVLCDEEKLKIAFLNIIINAIEAMEEDIGKLYINIRNEKTEHIIVIRDNGCGISSENLSHLFEPYFTSKRNGMGLGLASTLNILQSHHASIEVQSKLNEGTTFTVIFKESV